MTAQMFRANVGIAVLKEDREVLVFERLDVPGAWQLPQGGLDDGEEPLEGAYRELEEETGLARGDIKLLAEYPEWLAYELPAEYRTRGFRGQVQKWFVFRLAADQSRISIETEHPEFAAFKWISLDELPSVAASFRKPTYRALANFLQNID